MRVKHITPILNVSDVPASIRWFERLGWGRCWTYNDGGMIAGAADADPNGPARFAAVGSGEVEVFLCRGAQGSRGGEPARVGATIAGGDDATPGVWMTWWLGSHAEVDAVYAAARREGFATAGPPVLEPWGVREFRLVHPDGHVFRVSSHAAHA